MIKQYIKQSIQMLKENRLVSVISIAGTAISIAMIMVVVLVFQIQFANFYPENNRCLLYTSPSPRDRTRSRMPSSA